MSIFIEYQCRKCGETYLADTPGEPHGVEETGQECGGVGDFANIRWLSEDADTVQLIFNDHMKYQTALENHELEMPNCSDPDCEFHHPEVREF
jgi:hypothetical protein